MKISLIQIKNILLEIRDTQPGEEGFDIVKFVMDLDPKTLNTICGEITGVKNINYSGNLFGDGEGDNFEEGAVEIVSDFLLSILNNWQRSKSFRSLIAMFLPPKMLNWIIKTADNSPKSEQF